MSTYENYDRTSRSYDLTRVPMATESEVEAALQLIRDLDRTGELDAYVERHDAERCNFGQVTFVFATR